MEHRSHRIKTKSWREESAQNYMEKRAEMELATVNPSIGALNLHVLVSIQKEPGDETTPIVGLARFTNEKSTY